MGRMLKERENIIKKERMSKWNWMWESYTRIDGE